MTNKALGFSNYGPALVEHCLLDAGLSTTAKTKGTPHFPIEHPAYRYIRCWPLCPVEHLRIQAFGVAQRGPTRLWGVLSTLHPAFRSNVNVPDSTHLSCPSLCPGAAEDLGVEDLDRLAACFNSLDSTVLRQLDMPGQPGYILAKHQDDATAGPPT